MTEYVGEYEIEVSDGEGTYSMDIGPIIDSFINFIVKILKTFLPEDIAAIL